MPGSLKELPGPTQGDVRGDYRDVFFRPEDFFIRTAAFFPGFFLAALAILPPPFNEVCRQYYPRLSVTHQKS